MALLLKEINLNKKAILDLRDYYIAHAWNGEEILCKDGVFPIDTKGVFQDYGKTLLLDVLKNIAIKLKENENIGIVIADYDTINFIKNNYNSIDFKRMIFIIDFDKNRAAFGISELEKIERDNKNNIVKLSHYNNISDSINCIFADREYEEVF